MPRQSQSPAVTRTQSGGLANCRSRLLWRSQLRPYPGAAGWALLSVFFPPSHPQCGVWGWVVGVGCLFLFFGLFGSFLLVLLFILLGRTPWVGAGVEGLRRFPSV
jgi:hypothetical protein